MVGSYYHMGCRKSGQFAAVGRLPLPYSHRQNGDQPNPGLCDHGACHSGGYRPRWVHSRTGRLASVDRSGSVYCVPLVDDHVEYLWQIEFRSPVNHKILVPYLVLFFGSILLMGLPMFRMDRRCGLVTVATTVLIVDLDGGGDAQGRRVDRIKRYARRVVNAQSRICIKNLVIHSCVSDNDK